MLLLLVFGQPARASSAIEEAKEHFSRGAEHYQAGRYQIAHDEFEIAYRLSQHPDMLYNMARAEERLGRNAEAVMHLEQCLAAPETTDREEVKALLDRLRRRAPAPPPSATVAPAPSQPLPPVLAPYRPTPLYLAKWSTAAAAAAFVTLGAVLIGIDGNQDCALTTHQCKTVLDTRTGGILLLTGGLLLGGTSAVLFYVDYSRSPRGALAFLGLGGRF